MITVLKIFIATIGIYVAGGVAVATAVGDSTFENDLDRDENEDLVSGGAGHSSFWTSKEIKVMTKCIFMDRGRC